MIKIIIGGERREVEETTTVDELLAIEKVEMSMDIMGIHKEELLDGVELGGVSTFLGSGEQSDMSLFI